MLHDVSRYRGLIQSVAEQAVAAAVDASPHRARPDEVRYSLTQMLPAARRLLGQDVELKAPPTGLRVSFVDGRGQQRPVYRCLAAYLHWRATGDCPVMRLDGSGDPAIGLWQLWHRQAEGGAVSLSDVEAIVGLGANAGGEDAPLRPQSSDESPDHWTYRELTGLHALQAIASGSSLDDETRAALRGRIAGVARYHQQHTQPDYTTYQPWAVSAFLSEPATTWFAEQQLHDVQTHLAIEGGGGAVLPALLLASAYADLAG